MTESICLKNLSQIVRQQRLLLQLKNDFWAKAYSDHRLWPEQVYVDTKTGFLILEDCDFQLNQSHSNFLPALPYVRSLIVNGGKFALEADEIVVEIDDLRLLAQTPQDLAILYEVFSCGCYRFKAPMDHQKFLLWDVGMNVGITSLYFARDEAFDAVIGYEPFTPTFQQAERQFALNPAFASKITPINKGIGDKNETLSVSYNTQDRASLNVFDAVQPAREQKASSETVQIEDAVEVMRRIMEQYPHHEIVVKMDCEGGEHRILPALSKAKILPFVKTLMLEWHGPDTNSLEQILLKNGFSFFSTTVLAKSQGYIYAIHK